MNVCYYSYNVHHYTSSMKWKEAGDLRVFAALGQFELCPHYLDIHYEKLKKKCVAP